jgi:hypothetical protein
MTRSIEVHVEISQGISDLARHRDGDLRHYGRVAPHVRIVPSVRGGVTRPERRRWGSVGLMHGISKLHEPWAGATKVMISRVQAFKRYARQEAHAPSVKARLARTPLGQGSGAKPVTITLFDPLHDNS